MAATAAKPLRTAVALLACLTLATACASPRALYDGPPLPREKVARLFGFPAMDYREGTGGRGNTLAASGRIVPVGIDGRIFNPRVYAAYSGDDFLIPSGRHTLLAYCERTVFTPGGSIGSVAYSDLFEIAFTAGEGRTYRYQPDFYTTAVDHGAGHAGRAVLMADPGIWDVTENRSADSSNRVNEQTPDFPVVHPSLARIQAAVGAR